MQASEENVAICVSFAPLKNYQILMVTPYFIMTNIEIKKIFMTNIEIKFFREGVNKTYENQDFQKGNMCM